MPKHTPYSAGDPIKSAYTNDDIDGLSTGENDTDNNSLRKFREESLDPYFANGCTWSITSGLIGTMSAGVLYMQGDRIAISGVGSKTFTASKDTYVDIHTSGTKYYSEVTNGATAPTLEPNRIRNAIIVTNATDITTVIQKDRDTGGNLVYNDRPVAKESSAPRVTLTTTGTPVTLDCINTDVLAITALATAVTINQPAGTPANAQGIMYRIKDNGTARAITWNGIFRPIGITLPTATVASKTTYVAARYNTQDNKWDVLSIAREA